MAVPTFVSSSSLAWGSARTTSSVPVPAGVAAGDVVLVHVYTEDTTPTITPPTGFTELTFTPAPVTTGQIQQQRVFWKRLTAADTGTYAFTHASARTEATASAYRGALASGAPVGVLGSAVSNTQVNPAPAVSGTTGGADRMLVWAATWYSAAADAQQPTGFTEVYDGQDLETGYKAQPTAGATGSIVGGSATTTTNYTVTLVGVIPGVAANSPPTANAGADQANVEPWSIVTLTGTDSDSDGTIATRSWTQISGSPTVALSGTGATRTFIAPGTLAGATLGFRYSVTDSGGATTIDDMTVTVLLAPERIMVSGSWVPARISLV